MSISSSPTRSGPKRQTIINGPSQVSVNSYAGSLISATGLVATANSSVTPVVLSFAAGFGPKGAIEHIGQRSAIDTVILQANTTNYLYYERNPANGVVSFGTDTGRPAYSPYPLLDSNGTVWFNTIDYVMRQRVAGAWVPLQRVYCGEVRTGASAPTKTITYAYNGAYLSAPQSIGPTTVYTFEDNLGISILQKNVTVYGLGNGASGGASAQVDQFTFNGVSYGYATQCPDSNTTIVLTATNPIITGNMASGAAGWEQYGIYWLRVDRAF